MQRKSYFPTIYTGFVNKKNSVELHTQMEYLLAETWNSIIKVTSKWALWRLKSPAFGKFAQPFVQAQIKNIKDPRQRSASLAFLRGIHRWPAESPRRGLEMRKMFSFDDVIMHCEINISKNDSSAMIISKRFLSIGYQNHCSVSKVS